MCNFDGTTLVQGQRNPWEIVTAGRLLPAAADNARLSWASRTTSTTWGTAATWPCRAASRTPGSPTSRTSPPAATGCVGGRDGHQGWLHLRLSHHGRAIRERVAARNGEGKVRRSGSLPQGVRQELAADLVVLLASPMVETMTHPTQNGPASLDAGEPMWFLVAPTRRNQSR